MRLLLAVGLLIGPLVGGALGCTVVLDADGRTGHPCDGERERCLPGYSCVEGLCLEDPSTGVRWCKRDCGEGEKCDLRVGKCVDVCAASVCPTGYRCVPGSGCEPAEEGLGSLCETDSDCSRAVPGCSVHPNDSARVHCACVKPANDDVGICVGIPARSGDCEACGPDARCVQERFSYSGPTTVCLPGGFRTCAEGQAHCADTEFEAFCTVFAWSMDPGSFRPGEHPRPARPLGVFGACVTAAEAGLLEPGDECDPGEPASCASGLCVPVMGGGGVCSHPCRRDILCREVADGRCVLAPVDNWHGGVRLFETTRVCGSAPTLGRVCSVGRHEGCGTDAPHCVMGIEERGTCTRPCRDDADCSPAQGFVCHPRLAACF